MSYVSGTGLARMLGEFLGDAWVWDVHWSFWVRAVGCRGKNKYLSIYIQRYIYIYIINGAMGPGAAPGPEAPGFLHHHGRVSTHLLVASSHLIRWLERKWKNKISQGDKIPSMQEMLLL